MFYFTISKTKFSKDYFLRQSCNNTLIILLIFKIHCNNLKKVYISTFSPMYKEVGGTYKMKIKFYIKSFFLTQIIQSITINIYRTINKSFQKKISNCIKSFILIQIIQNISVNIYITFNKSFQTDRLDINKKI